MRSRWRITCCVAALTAICMPVAWTLPAAAQDESVVTEGPTIAEPSEPSAAAPATMPQPTAEPMASPAPAEGAAAQPSAAMPAPVCQPCVVYRTHRSARRMYRCTGEKQLVMVTQNPADCCQYEVPLCVPCCCDCPPTVCSDCGLFGRGVVTYCWPCGFEAKVVFRNRGDVKVHYRG